MGLYRIDGHAKQWPMFMDAVGLPGEKLVPWVAAFNLVIVVLILFFPSPYVFLLAALWAFCAAFVRPIAQTGWKAWAEAVERAGNWAPALSIFFIETGRSHLVGPLLSVAVFCTFSGHGLMAWMVHEPWFKFMAVSGYTPYMSRILLPLVGIFDFWMAASCGAAYWYKYPLSVLAAVLAMTWGFGTALMRPLSDESILGVVERFGNFLTPAAVLFLLTHPGSEMFYSSYESDLSDIFPYNLISVVGGPRATNVWASNVHLSLLIFSAGFLFCAFTRGISTMLPSAKARELTSSGMEQLLLPNAV
jgi:hypothetical protein